MLTTHEKGSEKQLIEVVTSVKSSPGGYWGLHFRFSELLEHYKTDYQLKISVNIINDILQNGRGNIIITSDGDIFVLARGVTDEHVKKLVFQLRYLYMDDPLAYDHEGEDNPKFVQIYELAHHWNDFFSAARFKYNELEDWNKPQQIQRSSPQLLTPERLSYIESELGKTNIASALRTQPVCVVRDSGFKVMYHEIYINISALSGMLSSEIDLHSNMALFKYLTQILDRRVLEIIRKSPVKYMRSPISLNLNIESLLSSFFAEFDSTLEDKVKKNIIIEISAGDLFGNTKAFVAAREMLQKKGYRICLDGLDNLAFQQLDRDSLGFDLAKILWNAELKTEPASEESLVLFDAIEKCGNNRLILCRCDNERAVEYGKSLNISLFQGRYLDTVVDPESVVVN